MSSKLRERLQRLREPVEVDAIDEVVADAENAIRLQVEALAYRIEGAVADLSTQTRDVVDTRKKARQLHDETAAGGGIMATLRASLANDDVEDARENMAGNLHAEAAGLTRRVQRSLALAEDVDILIDDVAFATSGLADLERRASGAGLHREARLIQDATTRLVLLRPSLQDMADPLADPVKAARNVVESATRNAALLRSTERAATLGESVLDSVISPGGGKVAQRLRDAVGDAAPGLVPDVARDAMGRDDALSQLETKLDEASRKAREDEEHRRAAEAELDALEWDP